MKIEEYKQISLSCGQLTLIEDGIVQFQCIDHTYTENDVKEINLALGRIANGEKVLQLVIASDYSTVNPAARKAMGRPEYSIFSIAEAYLIKSLAQKILGNFYLKIDKPSVPTRLFNDYDEALNWLRQFKK